jgi:hypothetical protein
MTRQPLASENSLLTKEKFLIYYENRMHTVHCESKKGPLYFCPYLRQILADFHNLSNIELRIKFTTKHLLQAYFTTNPERVATLSCEIINCTNDAFSYRR